MDRRAPRVDDEELSLACGPSDLPEELLWRVLELCGGKGNLRSVCRAWRRVVDERRTSLKLAAGASAAEVAVACRYISRCRALESLELKLPAAGGLPPGAAARLAEAASSSAGPRFRRLRLRGLDGCEPLAGLLRVRRLPSLQQLDVSENGLSLLPAEIGRLSGLQDLRVQGCQLAALPAEIGRLSRLQALDARGNRLTDLPAAVGQLSELRLLVLSGNQLRAVPAEIAQLTSLEKLWLSNNRLERFPAEIARLPRLRELYIGGNELASLPAAIGQLSALHELHASHNSLTSLPPEIGRLSALERLDVQHNRLESLPREIGRLPLLAADPGGLSAASNPLTDLPAPVRHDPDALLAHLSSVPSP